MDLSFQADLKYPHRNGNRPHDEFIWLQECMKQNNNKDFVHLSSEQADKVDNFKLDSLYDVMSVNEEAPVMYCNTKIMLRKMLGDIISQKEVAIVIQRWYRDTYRFGLICMVAVATQEMTYLVPVLKDYQLATRVIQFICSSPVIVKLVVDSRNIMPFMFRQFQTEIIGLVDLLEIHFFVSDEHPEERGKDLYYISKYYCNKDIDRLSDFADWSMSFHDVELQKFVVSKARSILKAFQCIKINENTKGSYRLQQLLDYILSQKMKRLPKLVNIRLTEDAFSYNDLKALLCRDIKSTEKILFSLLVSFCTDIAKHFDVKLQSVITLTQIGKLIRVKIPTSIQTIAEILSDCKYLKSQEPEMIKVLNSILPREFEETITQEMEIDSDEYNDLEITHEELEERTSAPSLVEETTPTPADVTLIDRTSQGVKITVTVPTSSRTVPLRPSAPFDSSRTCSSCGEVGHFRRNCQNDWVPNRFKLSRSQLSKKNKKRGGRKVQERKHQLLNQPQS